MRFSVALLLGVVLSTAHAQRPTIAEILSMRDCLDTACISKHAEPLGYCLMGGVDEDGYTWLPCAAVRAGNWKNVDRAAIGFWLYGDGGSHYSICTDDTAYADTLTYELARLGFHPPEPSDTVYTPYRYTPYRNPDYPDFYIRLDEVRWRNDNIPQLTWRFKVILKH